MLINLALTRDYGCDQFVEYTWRVTYAAYNVLGVAVVRMSTRSLREPTGSALGVPLLLSAQSRYGV